MITAVHEFNTVSNNLPITRIPNLEDSATMWPEMELAQWLRYHRKKANLTQKELAAKSGISQGYIAKLENKLAHNPGKPVVKALALAMGLSIPDTNQGLLAAGLSAEPGGIDGSAYGPPGKVREDNPLPQYGSPTGDATIKIPLLGRVAAGTPLFAPGNIEEIITVRSDVVRRGEEFITYALTVEGTSMAGIGIMNGDRIYVRQAEMAEDGQIVVALKDESCTVKRFRRFPVEGGWKTFLEKEPEPGKRAQMELNGWRIIGVVIGLERNFR